MKISKFLMIIIFIVAFTPANAQDYYYYKGEKIPLKLNREKVSIITNKDAYSEQLHNIVQDLSFKSITSGGLFNLTICESSENSFSSENPLRTMISNRIDTIHSKVLQCYLDENDNDLIQTNFINIKLKSLSDSTLLAKICKNFNALIINQDSYMPLWYTISITPDTPIDAIKLANLLYESNSFSACEPDFIQDSYFISWDKEINSQWGLYNVANDSIDINVSSAWNIATGNGIKIAVIDTGVSKTHIDLKDNLYYLSCDTEISSDNDIYSSNVYTNHGTQVAGIAAAIRNNGIQIAGVAPDAKIMSVSNRLISETVEGSESENRAFGINWAWKNGAEVINCSWGSIESQRISDSLDSALYRGRNGKGCIVVFASGNSSVSRVAFPARYKDEIMAVGAIDVTGNRASFSNYGIDLDVVAPGDSILTTDLNNTISYARGTSMAAPFVSGLAALILERNPDLTGQQVRDIIEQNTTKVGDVPYTTVEGRPNGTWNAQYGYGLIDAYRALKATPRKKENY